jgi:hypothetical protein
VVIILPFAIGAANALFSTSQVDSVAAVQRQADGQARGQAAVIARLNAAIAQLRRQQLAACNAAADLGSVPLPRRPVPSKLAVSLVTDNRAQWHGLGCPGSLPVPPGLAEAAARYHVPVNGKERP